MLHVLNSRTNKLICGCVLAATAFIAHAQVAAAAGAEKIDRQMPRSSVAAAMNVSASSVSLPVRELADPQIGTHWLLLRNETNPAGPGRMVLADPATAGSTAEAMRRSLECASQAPVVRAGNRVVVEEHTAKADAWLEAVALGRAAAGQSVDVRLKIGGRTVHATALAQGRAILIPNVATNAEAQR